MSQIYDLILHNISLASFYYLDKDDELKNPYGIVDKPVICIKDGLIVDIFNADDPSIDKLETEESIDGHGQWVTPGLIDCHTHLVYGGNRTNEFEMRLNGKSYEEIARAGGGIVSTVKATRKASKDELFKLASKRLSYLMDEGVTSLEIKSGYGLDLETEQKMLEVAEELNQFSGIEISKTFLGAHAVPVEYKDRPDEYIQLVCETMMPELNKLGLIDCVDAFCEGIGFTVKQTKQVFEKAKELGLPVKLHSEQLSDLGGSKLACEYNAWSVDHLEFLNRYDIEYLKTSGTVATLLPGAFYFLSETKLPPIQALRENNIPIAIATDSNPGSSPCLSILLMLNMATTLFKLTPAEALKGITINAAKALNIDDKVGSITIGKQADLVFWDIVSPAELSYQIGGNPCKLVIKKGKVIINKN
ncbi:MAG: imidazolonepropionase [Kangiella sp.]|nr:MAG: imidazolonepropionase [Kangiella sp.]